MVQIESIPIEGEYLEQSKRWYLARREDVGVIATLSVQFDGDFGWINDLYVLPDFRGQGVARKLVERVTADMQQASFTAGILGLACGIHPDNTASITLAARCGFRYAWQYHDGIRLYSRDLRE